MFIFMQTRVCKYQNMAGNKNLQSLSNLVKAISRLSENSTESHNGGETQESTNDVEAAIRTLFPSTNGSTQANRDETRVAAEHGALNMPDRRIPENTERFVPNRKYGSRKRPRNLKSSTGKKPKCNEQRTVLKDVILLHGPKQDKVPRGMAREALFALGFTTTFELSSAMGESEIRSLLEEKFKSRLDSISRRGNKFQFVRAINSKIIPIENFNQQEGHATCDGRLLKHISGQGPLYIRANEDISAPLQAYLNSKQRRDEKSDDTDNEIESESSTGDEEAIIRNTMHKIKPCPSPIVRVDLSNLDDDAAPGEDNVLRCDPSHTTGESLLNTMPLTSTPLATEQPIRVRCPTCEKSFLSHEIESHADGCAEAAWTGSEHLVYARLMADIEADDQDLPGNQSAPEENGLDPVHLHYDVETTADDESPADIKPELIGTLETLQTNINKRTDRINVQRTSVLDDYIDARKRCPWMHPENRLRVVFIGEPAIDTGGPRREFCSGE